MIAKLIKNKRNKIKNIVPIMMKIVTNKKNMDRRVRDLTTHYVQNFLNFSLLFCAISLGILFHRHILN
jgi:hypothetical protein